MMYNEIEKRFMGKWVLIVNCEYSDSGDFLGGIPVAVAESIFEGQEDGFYDEFKDQKYAPRTYRDFNYDNVPGFVNFFATAEMVGENANTEPFISSDGSFSLACDGIFSINLNK